jgi:hypothetical protein
MNAPAASLCADDRLVVGANTLQAMENGEMSDPKAAPIAIEADTAAPRPRPSS